MFSLSLFARLKGMKHVSLGPILACCAILSLCLTSCFWKTEKSPAPSVSAPASPAPVVPQVVSRIPGLAEAPKKDRTLEIFTKYFEQADAIHREAWWVLNNERRPVQKSPFGKVLRAILASENTKLANKSAFRCDRYIFKRDVLGPSGFPQKSEVFEKCSEKTDAKKIAEFFAPSKLELQVTFFPENLEEILGLGPTVLNRSIKCTMKGNESEQLEHLKCVDWAQERNKEQMILLDEYDYTRTGKNLIKLRGKVYENLSDTRKIEADVPMEGKIVVKETELYPPEPVPEPSAKPATAKSPVAPQPRAQGAPPMVLRPEEIPPDAGVSKIPIPPVPSAPMAPRTTGPAPVVDPDVLMQQQQQQTAPYPEGEPPAELGEQPPEQILERERQNQEPTSGGEHGR